MISWIIVAVLAVALAITIFIITHQKKVHAAALYIERVTAAYHQQAADRWSRLHVEVTQECRMVKAELHNLKLKIEADAKAVAAEPGKIAAAVESKITGKKQK